MIEPEIQTQTIQSVFSHCKESEVLSVLGPVADYVASLDPAERDSVSAAVAKRQREFSTGRRFARQLMAALGLPASRVLVAPDRAPQWPEPMLGSISHSDQLAWVVGTVRGRSRVRSLGADIERLRRLQPELNSKLFTVSELRRLRQLAADPAQPLLSGLALDDTEGRCQQLATLWFSAKEAVYKATAPIAGAFIGFQEVELLPAVDGLGFSMRYLGHHGASAIMEQGTGYLGIRDDHALALYTISRSDAA
ncbi:MAG: 4'-phosphopantetheinyl transferase [Pseudomonadales bacterium]